MFFDFHIHGDSRLALKARRLGYNGVAIIQSSKNYSHKKSAEIKEFDGDFRIWSGVEIYARNPEDLKKKVHKFRDKEDILIVNGGNLKINRAACEDPRVDILAHPYKNRRDSGINHVHAKKVSENEVAIELSIASLIKTRFSLRARLLSQFRQIIKMHRKFGFPIIISSNAYSIYDLRTPHDIIALACCFGMTVEEAEDSLSKNLVNIIERNKIRKNTVVKGVNIIE